MQTNKVHRSTHILLADDDVELEKDKVFGNAVRRSVKLFFEYYPPLGCACRLSR